MTDDALVAALVAELRRQHRADSGLIQVSDYTDNDPPFVYLSGDVDVLPLVRAVLDAARAGREA